MPTETAGTWPMIEMTDAELDDGKLASFSSKHDITLPGRIEMGSLVWVRTPTRLGIAGVIDAKYIRGGTKVILDFYPEIPKIS